MRRTADNTPYGIGPLNYLKKNHDASVASHSVRQPSYSDNKRFKINESRAVPDHAGQSGWHQVKPTHRNAQPVGKSDTKPRTAVTAKHLSVRITIPREGLL